MDLTAIISTPVPHTSRSTTSPARTGAWAVALRSASASCHLTAEIENGVVTRVTGNTCRRGEDYAKKECVAPMRTVTGTVALRGGRLPVLPVRTNGEVFIK